MVDVPRPGVLITQSGDRGLALAEALRNRGFRAEHVPLIETVPLSEALAQVDRIAQDGEAWAFTSAAAVRAIAGHARAVLRLGPRLPCTPSERPPGARFARSRLRPSTFPACAALKISPRGSSMLAIRPSPLSSRAGGWRSRRCRRRCAARAGVSSSGSSTTRSSGPRRRNRFAERAGDVIALFSPSAVAAIAAHPSARDIFAPGRFLWLPLGETTARALDQQGVRHLEPPPEPSHEALIVHLETLYPVGA